MKLISRRESTLVDDRRKVVKRRCVLKSAGSRGLISNVAIFVAGVRMTISLVKLCEGAF